MHTMLQINVFDYGTAKANPELKHANDLTIGLVQRLAHVLLRWHEVGKVKRVGIIATHSLYYNHQSQEQELLAGCQFTIIWHERDWPDFEVFFPAKYFEPYVATRLLNDQLEQYYQARLRSQLINRAANEPA